MKKKLLALILVLTMGLSLAACSDDGDADGSPAPSDSLSSPSEPSEPAGPSDGGESDLAYVQNKGTLIIGITEFEPMDYQDADGNWIGFDADTAVEFANYLGVEPVFQIISDWDNKIMELNGKTVDVVWNGMTATDEVLSSMECSAPYFNNTQVVVVPADAADQYQTVESLAGLQFAAENGSAGQAALADLNYSCTPVQDQATALLEVSSGTADAAVIDYLMALAMTGEGTSYANLTYTVSLTEEEYVVGFRKGSDLAAELDTFFDDQFHAGYLYQRAAEYGIEDNLVHGTES